MKRNVQNEKIERSFYQGAINERVKRTVRVARACFAATVAGAVIGVVGQDTEAAPAVATVIPAGLIAVAERRRSTMALDNLVYDYAHSIDSTRSAYISEKARIVNGRLESTNYWDGKAFVADMSWIGFQQSGGLVAGMFATSMAAGHTPEAAIAPVSVITCITGGAAIAGAFMDGRTMQQSYTAKLQNIEGVQGIS